MDINYLRAGIKNRGGSARPREDSQDLALENQRLTQILDAIAESLKFANNTGSVDHIRFILIQYGGYDIADLTVPGAVLASEHLLEPPKKVE